MFRCLITRILGFAGRINGGIWDHTPLLQNAPPPPVLGQATRVPHLRVIEGSLKRTGKLAPIDTGRVADAPHVHDAQLRAGQLRAGHLRAPHLRAL